MNRRRKTFKVIEKEEESFKFVERDSGRVRDASRDFLQLALDVPHVRVSQQHFGKFQLCNFPFSAGECVEFELEYYLKCEI